MVEKANTFPPVSGQDETGLGFRISRKNFFGSLAFSVGGLLTLNEIDKYTEGIATPEGIFFPLYETHSKALTIKIFHGT